MSYWLSLVYELLHAVGRNWPAILMLALKLGLVASISSWTEKHSGDRLSAWLASWILVHTAMVATILALSPFGALSTPVVWGVMIVGLVIFRFPRKISFPPITFGWMIFAAITVLMAVRASIFFEFTADAQDYGLVRLGIWMNYGSVIVQMPTEQINIFSNEWNGELVSLWYGLASRSIQGLMLGNVEILLVLFLSSAWLGVCLGADRRTSYLTAALVTSSPAYLGLAATMKGDLLAVAAAVLAAGWVVSIPKRPSSFTLALAILSASLAVGSKITAGPIFLVLIVTTIYLARRYATPKNIFAGTVVGLTLSPILLSRYIINAVTYGNFIKRTGNEKTSFGIDTLLGNLKYLIDMSLSFSSLASDGNHLGWLLAAGLGLTGLVAIGIAFSKAVILGTMPTKVELWLFFTGVASVFVTGIIVPQQPWSYRYFLPGITVMLLGVVQIPAGGSTLRRHAISVLLTAAIATNFNYIFWPGEISGNNSFFNSMERAVALTPLQRSVMHYPPLSVDYGLDEIDIDGDTPLLVAVHAFLGRPTAGLMGSHAQNRLVYFETESSLFKALDFRCFDLVALTKFENAPMNDSARAKFNSLGYETVTDGELLSISRNKEKCD